MPDQPTSKAILRLPPFVIPGAVLIFLPIVIFIVYQNIKSQQSNTHHLLLEKGAALIRSFEAGTRAGMRGRLWGQRRLQQLLEETAQQPDINYLIVTDVDGRILADNDTNKIGTLHAEQIDLEQVLRVPDIFWRIIDTPDKNRIFEVYKRFVPTGVPGNPTPPGMMRRFREGNPFVHPGFDSEEPSRIIFVGLDMKALDTAGKSRLMNSILTGVLLFLVGSAGIIVLFLFQNYRSAKTSLSRIKAFSDNLVDNMPIGLIALDSHKAITSMNETAVQILGQNEKDLVGRYAPGALPDELKRLIADSEEMGKIIGRETECVINETKTLPLEISISHITGENNELIGYALLIQDLTEIYQLRKEVAHSQRMASIGRLAAGVAHEIRNPLSSIKGFATYFRDRYREVDKDRQTANIMINEVDRLDRVVGQLLELARPVQVVPQLTEMGKFIEASTHLIRQKIQEKEIELKIGTYNQPVEIFIDQDKINQVLLNLYLNALDAMDKNGLLKVDFWFNSVTDTVSISILDSGKGIPEADLGKIFDPYYTTKPTGTGLGLAIVHNILEAHQGKIKVESTTGSGTVVTITIPNLKPERSNG